MPNYQLAHHARLCRLLLARLSDDPDAAQLVGNEIGNCPHCWRVIAKLLLRLCVEGWVRGNDSDAEAIVAILLAELADTLDQLEAS